MTVIDCPENDGAAERDVELGFDAEIDGQGILFLPTSPYSAKLRRDDETTVWCTYVQKPKPSPYVDERVTLHRHATRDEVLGGYRAARHVRTLAKPVRRLLEIAEVVYCKKTWVEEAAADLSVPAEVVASWLGGEVPPDWLEARLLTLIPRLAYAQRRHEWLSSLAGSLIESLGGYDEAQWRYHEPKAGPDDF
jgi:hypothetical protein